MDGGLSKLNKKIKSTLEEKDLPEHIKKEILDIFNQCQRLCEDYINEYLKLETNRNTFENIQRYINRNQTETILKIRAKYKERYKEKAEVITIVLSTLEAQKDKKIEKSEIDILEKCIRNSKENDLNANNITNIVIDSIQSMKKQLFKGLELLKTDKEKIEYIASQVKLIENSAREKLASIKADLDVQDEEILNQILFEYEQYKESKIKQSDNTIQNAHQRFVNEYKISQDDLQISSKAVENTNYVQEKDEDLDNNII